MLGRDARDVTTVTAFKCRSRRYGGRKVREMRQSRAAGDAPRETRQVLSQHGAEL